MKEISLKQFIRVLPPKMWIKIRRAFGDGDYYEGFVSDVPETFEYKNRRVIFSYFWGRTGDIIEIQDAKGLDIAVGDFEVEE